MIIDIKLNFPLVNWSILTSSDTKFYKSTILGSLTPFVFSFSTREKLFDHWLNMIKLLNFLP